MLKKLAFTTGFTASLSIKEEYGAYFIDRVEPPNNIKLVTQIGSPVPLHSSASGKVILAHLAPSELEIFLALNPLVPHTPKTITSRNELEKELGEVRKTGIAWDLEENSKRHFLPWSPDILTPKGYSWSNCNWRTAFLV